MRTYGKFFLLIEASAFQGEVDKPLPIWLTMMTKYFSGLMALPAPTYTSSMTLLVPENQVVIKIAFDLSALSVPNVRTASWRLGILPPSANSKSPMEINS